MKPFMHALKITPMDLEAGTSLYTFNRDSFQLTIFPFPKLTKETKWVIRLNKYITKGNINRSIYENMNNSESRENHYTTSRHQLDSWFLHLTTTSSKTYNFLYFIKAHFQSHKITMYMHNKLAHKTLLITCIIYT